MISIAIAYTRKRKYVKLIDFGKCTLAEDSVTYSIKLGSDKQKFCNKYHCHLACEILHVPGSRVCFKTDIYSVGYFFLAEYQIDAN